MAIKISGLLGLKKAKNSPNDTWEYPAWSGSESKSGKTIIPSGPGKIPIPQYGRV
jgi:hypothetical protein